MKVFTTAMVVSLFSFPGFAIQPMSNFTSSVLTHTFIENAGQIVDQYGAKRDDVRYVYNEHGFKIILRNTGFSYEWTKAVADNGPNTESGQHEFSTDEDEDIVIPEVHFVSNRIDVELVNCNIANIHGIGNPVFYANYFNQYTTYKGITAIPSFSKIIYENIYDGIDLVFSTIPINGKIQPEYEFIVHPSGKISNISLSYNGQQNITVSPAGELNLDDQLGYVREARPLIILEDGSMAGGAFLLDGNTVKFKSLRGIKNQTLTIDPAIAWGTYYGGSGKDIPDELATDSHQNVYITGSTRSYSNIATAGAYQTVYSGGDDAVIIKFDTNGNLVWATYYGGSGNDVAFDITIDRFDNVYIGGRTVSPAGIATPGAVIDTFSGGYFDVFIAKFNSQGMLQWGTYMGGPLKDEVQGLATDASGQLYVSGYSESLTGIVTPGAYKTVGDTAGESFLMKFTPDGHQVFGTYFGDMGRDRGHGVWADGFGHVYQVGTTNSKLNIATPGAFQEDYAGLLDAFFIQWTEDGHIKWCTYYGGPGDERPRDVRTDDAGYIYFVGQTESESQIATEGSFKTTLQYLPGNNRDAFVVKFDSTCHRIWGTYYGGNKIEMPRSMRVGHLGTPIYVGGYTKSNQDFSTDDAYQEHFGGFNDAFFGKINWNASQLMYSTYYGGQYSESVTAGGWYGSPLDVDVTGNIYLSSCTISPDGIATMGAFDTTYNSGDDYDYFLTKFTDACSDPFEPNDSTNVAPVLPFSKTSDHIQLSALIQKPKDKDYFIIYSKPGLPYISVSLTNVPFDCNLFLYDSILQLISKSQNTGTADEFVHSHDDSYTGKYYVLVKSPFGISFDPENCYKLSISSTASFRQENDLYQKDDDKWSVYPNPADDFASIISTEKTDAIEWSLVNVVGEIVLSSSISPNTDPLKISTSDLSEGIYFINVYSGREKKGNARKIKLIVQH